MATVTIRTDEGQVLTLSTDNLLLSMKETVLSGKSRGLSIPPYPGKPPTTVCEVVFTGKRFHRLRNLAAKSRKRIG